MKGVIDINSDGKGFVDISVCIVAAKAAVVVVLLLMWWWWR